VPVPSAVGGGGAQARRPRYCKSGLQSLGASSGDILVSGKLPPMSDLQMVTIGLERSSAY